MVKIGPLFAPFFVVLASGAAGCSHAPPTVDAAAQFGLDFGLAPKPSRVEKLWVKTMPGAITDLSVADSGHAILVATAPDSEIEGSASRYLLSRFDGNGRMVWRKEVGSPVKAQAIAGDGSLALVATYDDRLTAYDPRGKQLWVSEGTCKPIALARKRRVLCYHDDDAQPQIAFDLLNWSGKKLLSYPIANDVLTLKVSGDEQNIAIGMTRGQFAALTPERTVDYQTLWQRKVPGEIRDVAISSGDAPFVAVLWIDEDSKQFVDVWDATGKLVGRGKPTRSGQQVEFSPSSAAQGPAHFAVYGNSREGQILELFDVPGQVQPKVPSEMQIAGAVASTLAELPIKWSRYGARFADYATPLLFTENSVILGFEDTQGTSRHSHLLAFDLEGHLDWNIPLITDEGAYIYAQEFADRRRTLAVGSDDGRLHLYSIQATR